MAYHFQASHLTRFNCSYASFGKPFLRLSMAYLMQVSRHQFHYSFIISRRVINFFICQFKVFKKRSGFKQI